jgi:antitoxin component of RelBE/YafQ-DinJ toxin-antitoxin module
MQNTIVRFRLDERLLERARERADARGMTVSEFVRASLRSELSRAAA